MENMKNCVIIIESPNKCEKIEKYSGAKTHATKGHFMELDQNYINFSNYEPKFIMMESKRKQINFIAGQCKDKVVYIATDPDREGYVIGYNFYELIKNTAKSIKRAEFHEITQAGIEKGLNEAKDFSTTNKNLYEAGKARTVGDKMTGYIMSPKIGERFGVYKNNSVGRVQTPALALLVKREQEIIQYDKQPREQRLSYKILCEVLDEDNKTYITTNSNIFNDKEEAQSFIDSIANTSEAFVKTIESKDSKKAPPKPYQATTLIKDANKTYGFDSKKTMDIAQELFEKGLITYHRTDSEAISIDFIEQIEKKFANEEWYEKRIYKAGKHSQAEAHEAIRITNTSRNVEGLNEEQTKLYNLIYNNSIYSQSKDSIYKNTKYEFDILGREFTLTIRTAIYQSIFENTSEDEEDKEEIEKELPKFKEGDNVKIQELKIKEIEKARPKRYKEADFIPLLQKEGIGRPSTYATFVPLLEKREYIKVNKSGKAQEIQATEKGMKAIEFLNEMGASWITTSQFTKEMEEKLDKITENKATYLEFVKTLHEKMGGEIPSKKVERKKPTEKQIELAKYLAKKEGVTLPPEAIESMKECSNFIDKHSKPSQKQIEFAKKLAEQAGVKLPKEAETYSKACAEFIEKYKGKSKGKTK